MTPLVSVIVPLYNAAPYIAETIDSILASTYRPLEIVIVDDGSTDNPSLSFTTKESITIRVFRQENKGVSAARNYAIREAHGEYILPVDADDKISPTYIAHAVQAMTESVRVVGCKAEFFGDKTGEWRLPDYTPERLAMRNMIHISSLFSKADWEHVGGFCEEDIYREDWDFWLSIMSLGGQYVRLDEVGLYYRVHTDSRRHTAKAQKRAIVDAINRRHPAYIEKYLNGPLHYHRSCSKVLNRFRIVKQMGTFAHWYEGEIIFSHRNTLRLTDGIVVKHFAVPSILRGLWYGLFAKSKARRSYEHAIILQDLTPTPIAYREVRVCSILRESAYACALSTCTHTFNELINTPSFPNRTSILQSIGRFTATLHQRGILHRDYSGGNILFNDDGSRIEVIDLNRLSFHKHLTRTQRLNNFERLNIDRAALTIIASSYAEAMNEDPQATAKYIITHRWYKHVQQGITNL